MTKEKIAKVISVLPDKIKISVNDIEQFKIDNEKFSVGSYLRVTDHDEGALLCVIETFEIANKDDEDNYILEALPLGFIDSNQEFIRGGNNIAIPPTGVESARRSEISKVYNSIESTNEFAFSNLLQDITIPIPVNGNNFFNKHLAIVGATGSGKSHTVSSILQQVLKSKNTADISMNNSHIILFDIHNEYHSAFPNCNFLDGSNIKLPYWLMNGEEIEEMFIESSEFQSYNQISLLRKVILKNKYKHNKEISSLSFDTPVRFDIKEVFNCITNLSKETISYSDVNESCFRDNNETFTSEEEKYNKYFEEIFEFSEPARNKVKKGPYNDGSLQKFLTRLQNKISNKRLKFVFSEESKNSDTEDVIRQLIGYLNTKNITIIDLSGIPFEILSITVSLISRLLFDFAYMYKNNKDDNNFEDNPLLLVYEEAHKYVPKVDKAKYNSSRVAIERITKEGRKYGISAAIVSQRPSEISETIFSQCSNFITMRLTNPDDQRYIKKLLPDSLGGVTDSLATLKEGEAIIIGDSIVLPTLVKIRKCNPEPKSQSIKFLDHWTKEWYDFDFKKVTKYWK
ncbi:ATP-binding protein [Staphylococcus xylosus]|uniref:ATP-binding protein n=1 Tax=Staphylococcus xylosus TaxID=1288 RepID=UPI002040A013|nr:ATP-binding protein [Staphylococcus xylosus]